MDGSYSRRGKAGRGPYHQGDDLTTLLLLKEEIWWRETVNTRVWGMRRRRRRPLLLLVNSQPWNLQKKTTMRSYTKQQGGSILVGSLLYLETPSPVTRVVVVVVVGFIPLNKRCYAAQLQGGESSWIELNNNVKRKQASTTVQRRRRIRKETWWQVLRLDVVTLCACVALSPPSPLSHRLLLKDIYTHIYIYIYMYTRVKFFFREERQAPGKPGSIVTHSLTHTQRRKKKFYFSILLPSSPPSPQSALFYHS
jgi:hypothetical protein